MENFLDYLVEWVIKLGWGIFSFFSSAELVSYAALSGAVLCSVWATRLYRTRNLSQWRRRLMPRRIWNHPSARLDMAYYFIIQPAIVLILAPAIAFLLHYNSQELVMALEGIFGNRLAPSGRENPTWAILLYSLLIFAAIDFAFFISHYLQHKWRWLWCFHKVHHSAEVMVPFTAMRFHPLDMLWNMLWAAALTLIVSTLCQYFFYTGEQELKMFGNHIIIALSYLTTHNLRHSHIWLHYPHALSNWLLSPVQHQIHHSQKPEHWDKNFGYLFAFWDRLFGTLVNPRQFERLRFGVIDERGEVYDGHRTLKGMLLVPFKEAWGVITNRQRKR